MKSNIWKRIFASVMVACLFTVSCDFCLAGAVYAEEIREEETSELPGDESISDSEENLTDESEVITDSSDDELIEDPIESCADSSENESTEESGDNLSESSEDASTEEGEGNSVEVPATDSEIVIDEENLGEDESILYSGETEEGASWSIDSAGKLVVSGGKFSEEPWDNYKSSVKEAAINSKPIDNASALFYQYSNLEKVTFGMNFDLSECRSMYNMFYGCNKLEKVDLSNLDTSQIVGMGEIFCGCESLQSVNLSGLDTSSVTSMSRMFKNCKKLSKIDLSDIETTNVIYMDEMFSGCEQLKEVDLSGFNTSRVYDMSHMFYYCRSLEKVNFGRDFYTGLVQDMSEMFMYCSVITELDVSNFDTSRVTSMNNMFYSCEKLSHLDVSGFNTAMVNNMNNMFSNCKLLEVIDVSKWNTSAVTGFNGMFYGCAKLENLNVSKFNTQNAIDISSMFNGCSNLKSINVNNFNTDNVTQMYGVFSYCYRLTELDLSNWDTHRVKDMGCMFSNCKSLEKLNISSFNTENTEKMNGIFVNCSKLETLDLHSFNLKSVKDVFGFLDGSRSLTKIITPYSVTMSIVLPSIEGGQWFDGEKEVPKIECTDNSYTLILKRTDTTTDFELVNDTLTISVGTTQRLTTTDVADGFVSMNQEIATIGSNGVISALKIGTTTIMVKKDAKELSCAVVVCEKTPQAVVSGDKLTGLLPNTSYSVSGKKVKADQNGQIAIQKTWYDKQVSVVKINQNSKLNSKPQLLYVVTEITDLGAWSIRDLHVGMRYIENKDVIIPNDAHYYCESLSFYDDAEFYSTNEVTMHIIVFKASPGYFFNKKMKIMFNEKEITDYEYSSDNKSIKLNVNVPVAKMKSETVYSSTQIGYLYTGQPIKPEVDLDTNCEWLNDKEDYTVTYKNNINVATVNSAKAPSIIIKTKGFFADGKTHILKFNILPANFADAKVSTDQSSGLTIAPICAKANGRIQKPKPIVKYNGKTVSAKEYKLIYQDKDTENRKAYKDPGTYYVTIVGLNNFEGQFSVPFTISNRLIKSAKVTLDQTKYIYTGARIQPVVTVKDSSNKENPVLVEGKDYIVTYTNNITQGTAKVKITGIGNYSGEITKTFTITGKKIESKMFTGVQQKVVFGEDFEAAQSSITGKDGKTVLWLNRDYTLSYIGNLSKVGKIKILVKGVNAYTGTVTLTAQIVPKDITEAEVISDITTEDGNIYYYYQKGAKAPDIKMQLGAFELQNNVDFTVKCKNYKVSGDYSNPTTEVTIKGKGNYTGTKSAKVIIEPKDMSNTICNVNSYLITDKKNNYKVPFTIFDDNGKKLTAGVDYDNTNTVYYLVDSSNTYDMITSDRVPLDKGEYHFMAVIMAKRGGNYKGRRVVSYSAYTRKMADVKVAPIPVQTINPQGCCPKVTLTYAKAGETPTILNEATDYSITYEKNKQVGTATAIITGSGVYGGTKKVKFKIERKNYNWNFSRKEEFAELVGN